MTTETIYRVLCDAPYCSAAVVVEKLADLPDGWTRVDSTDHLADWKQGQKLRLANGHTKTDQRSVWDIHAGSFSVHLCQEHPGVFDGHRPWSEGTTTNRRTGDRHVTIRCECGWGNRLLDVYLVVSDREPRRTPERAWFRHLPEELRWYATRGAVPA